MLRKNFVRRVEIIQSRTLFLDCLRKTKKRFSYIDGVSEFCNRIQQNSDNHYLCFSLDDGSKITYTKPGFHRWDYNTRIRTTLGKYLRKQLRVDLPHDVLDTIVSDVFSHRPIGERFSIIRGEDIRQAYYNCIGGGSCMTGSDADEKLDIYTNNPDVVAMVVYKLDQFTARALLWRTDCGAMCLDRVYPNSGAHIPVFEKYAKQNRWFYRAHHSLPNDTIRFGGDVMQCTVTGNGETYPYTDSFLTTDDNPDNLTITLSTSINGRYRFSSIVGGWNDTRHTCCNCRSYVDEDYRRVDDEGNMWCDECFGSNHFYCDSCDSYHSESSAVIVRGSLSTDRWGTRSYYEYYWCANCASSDGWECVNCRNHYCDVEHNHYENENEDFVCENCIDDYAFCAKCEKLFSSNVVYVDRQDIHLCNGCLCDVGGVDCCNSCGKSDYIPNLDENRYCEDCVTDPVPF